LGTEIFKKEIT